MNVNGCSGYFGRSLAVYGREGAALPALRSAVVREPFMNRSRYRCPACQKHPLGRLSHIARTFRTVFGGTLRR